MVEFITGWTFVSIIVTSLIGIGIGVLSMMPPELQVARVCFTAAAVILLSKTAWWVAFEVGPTTERLIVCFFIFGVTVLLWVGGIYLARDRHPKVASTEPPVLPAKQEPFKVVADNMFINMNRDFYAASLIWVTYRSSLGDTMGPVAIVAWMDITNLTDHPETIKTYSVAIHTEFCGWNYLVPIDLDVVKEYWVGKGVKQAYVMDFSSALFHQFKQPIPAYQTIHGFMLLDTKVKCPTSQGEDVQLRIALETFSGIKYEYTSDPKPIINKPIVPGSSEGRTSLPVFVFAAPVVPVDISAFKLKFYSDELP